MSLDIEAYYRKYGPMVLRRCKNLLGDPYQAEDAMQDVFVQLLRNENRLEGTFPSSLLYTIATHVCLSRFRAQKRKREVRNEDILTRIACTEDFEKGYSMRNLLDHLFSREKESMREETRAMAVMHYVDGMTFEEVGRILGISAIGVRKRLERFKKKIVREAENR